MFKYLYLASFLIAIGKTAISPEPHQLECEVHALKCGWPIWIIRLTNSTQFFTLYSQLWLVVALFTNHRETAVIAMVLETTVCILYYVLLYMNAQWLSYHPPHIMQKVTAWFPPIDSHCIVWVGLHIQHLICPLHLWLVGGIEHRPEDVCLSVAAVLVYVGWNTFCWNVQGRPAYPIQQLAAEKHIYGPAALFYILITLTVAIGCDYLL